MPLNYSIYLAGNPIKPEEPKKAYARAQVNREVSLKALSEMVASQTTVSRADVSAVLISTTENMLRELRNGNQVDFGELGKFRLQISSMGADSAEVFSAANILGVSIQFVPGEELKTVFAGMDFNPVLTRKAARLVLKAQRAGKTKVDLENPGGMSDGGGVLPEPGGGGLKPEPGSGGGGSPETGGGGDSGSDPLV